MTGILIRTCGDKETQEEHYGKMKVEIGVMVPQAKEHLGLPEAGKERENLLLEAAESTNGLTPYLRLLDSRTVKQ